MPNDTYWDACLFIDAIQKTDADRVDCLTQLITKAKNKEIGIVTSAYTITEVNKLDDLEKSSGTKREDQSKLILSFFENEYIHVRAVTRQIAELAHDFTRVHCLKNADAIHVATAVIAKVDVLYTWDGKKQRRGGLLSLHMKVGSPPLRIELPPDPDLGTLYDKSNLPEIPPATDSSATQ